jgi:hypothetical protein
MVRSEWFRFRRSEKTVGSGQWPVAGAVDRPGMTGKTRLAGIGRSAWGDDRTAGRGLSIGRHLRASSRFGRSVAGGRERERSVYHSVIARAAQPKVLSLRGPGGAEAILSRGRSEIASGGCAALAMTQFT